MILSSPLLRIVTVRIPDHQIKPCFSFGRIGSRGASWIPSTTGQVPGAVLSPSAHRDAVLPPAPVEEEVVEA